MEATPIRLTQEVLRTDLAGMPLEWIDYRSAATLYHSEQVAYACGSAIYRVHGGYNARTGLRSIIEVNSIIATPRRYAQRRAHARALHAAAKQHDAVQARCEHLSLLRAAVFEIRAYARSHYADQSWRPGCLDQCRRGLSSLQQPQRRSNARRSTHAAARGTIHADVCRIHIPKRSPCAL